MSDHGITELFSSVEPAIEKLQVRCPTRTVIRIEGLDQTRDAQTVALLEKAFGTGKNVEAYGMRFDIARGFEVEQRIDDIRAAFSDVFRIGKQVLIQGS